jgi:hypothetical protein
MIFYDRSARRHYIDIDAALGDDAPTSGQHDLDTLRAIQHCC